MASTFGFRYAHEDPFSFEYSCGVCSRASSDEDLSAMILCEGGCKRIFHIECVGLSALPDTSASSKWACSRCIQRLCSCYVCDGVSEKNVSSGLLKCTVPHCGKFFHKACLAARYPDDHHDHLLSGTCPLHRCGVSSCLDPITEDSYFCILCLRAYHLKCLPDEVPVVCENVCVCADHQWDLASVSGKFFSIADRMRATELGRKLGKKSKQVPDESSTTTSTTPSMSPKHGGPASLDENEVRAWIGTSFKQPFSLSATHAQKHESLDAKEGGFDESGLDFVRLRANEWLIERKRKFEDEEAGDCGCTEVCDANCPNVICMTQCSVSNCGLTKRAGKSAGFSCGNRPFASNAKKSNLYKVVGAGGKGVGLVARAPIPKHTCLVEYIGEVISTDLWLERQGGGQKHFYVMELGPEILIDASRKGNDSRLMNHSCDPNFETQKWTVNGESRVGLFAIRDVAEGEELTFNYQFETFAAKPFKCLCGTDLCTGWIGGKKRKHLNNSKTGVDNAASLLPYTQLVERSAVDIRLSSVRADGTRKLDAELEQEELAVFNSKVDWALQYVWAGSQSAEEWVRGGRKCVSNSNLANFNPAAILGLSITKVEEHFIRERNLFVLRNLRKCRRDFARKFYHWPETVPAIESVLETNLISDDICVRCRRTGQLLWCKSCVRSFHQCCVMSGDKFVRDLNAGGDAHKFTCRRCVRVGTENVPRTPAALTKNWALRRAQIWEHSVLPSLLR